jgi:hypothetical protein
MGDKQPAKNGISMVESIILNPITFQSLNGFFESNEEKYSEIWEIPLAYSQSSA